MNWERLPFTVLYEIFCCLDNHIDIINCSYVCSHWFLASRDDRIWKKLFFSHYGVDRGISNGGISWYNDYKRLHYNVPTVETEVIHQHFDQVLHITFSHNGKFFVTCSRDCLVMIWHSSYPIKLKESLDMTVFNWRCAHYSEFNSSDSLLLVSGIVMGTETSVCGEIVVFYVEEFLSAESGILKMKCRIDNTPYSLFGTWYNESLLLSGNRFWLGGFVTAALIYVNKTSQETASEHIPVTHGLFKFYNTNRSSLTSLLIAKCLLDDELNISSEDVNEVHFDRSSFKNLQMSVGNFNVPLYTLIYNPRYREYEDNVMKIENSDDGEESTETSSSSEANLETADKLLIFVTGNNTFIPHEIGIKRIRSFKFPERINPGPSLKERQMLLNERKRILENDNEDLHENNLNALAEQFDTPDHLIDLHGHILGMKLSPDHRFLYVTLRRWPEWEQYDFFDVVDPVPSVQRDISLNVIDLVTLEIVGVSCCGIKQNYTVDSDFYFVFMDVSDDLIVSTGAGSNLHIWDRHFGIHLTNLKHEDICNGAAFNPKDPEMMVSVSDDSIIKIWRSKSKVRELKIVAQGKNNENIYESSSEEIESESDEMSQ